MEKMNSIPNERICDLVDGQLQSAECAQAFDAMLSDKAAMQTWHAYHVIGDVLRSSELAPSHSDLAFLQRFEAKLANEPARPIAVAISNTPAAADLTSANESVFRWKMLAGVASFALVGVIGLSLWTQTTPQAETQVAVRSVVPLAVPSTTIVAADTPAGMMLRDERLDELLAAHRQLGGHSALQVPAGFLRNATFEGPAQ